MDASTTSVCELTLVAWRLGDLGLIDLWWRYIGLGGTQPLESLADYLVGTTSWRAPEHNVLAQVLNERLWDLGSASLAPHRHTVSHRR